MVSGLIPTLYGDFTDIILYNQERRTPWGAFMDPDCQFSCQNDGPNSCDVALLAFNEDIIPSGSSSSELILHIYEGNEEVGKVITIYGCGLTGDAGTFNFAFQCRNADEDGQFRRAQNVVTSASNGVVEYQMDDSNELDLEGICQDGDSGGPATIEVNGVAYLAGANSGTMESNSCDYGSIDQFSRVSERSSFISKILDSNDKTICSWIAWEANPNEDCGGPLSSPTNPPTLQPAGSPPTSSPVSSPTSAPVVPPDDDVIVIPNCLDSQLKFLVNGRGRTCNWVAQKNTSLRCAKGRGNVATYCPLTCGTCEDHICIGAGKKCFLSNGNLKSCEWVKRKNSSLRCAKEGAALTCRETCSSSTC